MAVESNGVRAQTPEQPIGAKARGEWPSYAADEIEAVRRVLHSGRVNYWTGQECREFERECACSFETTHAVALANGTVALELALLALGVGPGDEVVTSPRSFIASASCVVMRGARPIFADVDRDSQNITPATIERVLTKRTRAIIPVHLAGWPCDMDGIISLARARGLAVIEDCAQATGAVYRNRPVGGLGDAGAFSFCQDKIITTGGEGGMLVTNQDEVWSRAWAFKDHGKSHESVYARSHPPGFRWVHESFGTNWRMTEMQAAIGRVQLTKLDKWVEKRRSNARVLIDGLQDLSCVRIPEAPANVRHAYYKLYVFLRPEALRAGWNRDRVMQEIAAGGVPCFSGSCSEMYLEKAFENQDLRPRERLPIARELGSTSLMFLVHPTLSPADLGQTTDVARTVFRRSTR